MRLEPATEPATHRRQNRFLRFNSLRAGCATVATVAAFSPHCTDALYWGDRATGAPAHRNRCRDRLDVCALDRSAFYKRRPTPKPGLDSCPRDCAEISAGISDKFPLGFRWRAVGQPRCVCRRAIVRLAACRQRIARGLRSTLHRTRSASGRLVGLHAGEDRCRQATRGTVEKRVQHKIRNFAQPKPNAENRRYSLQYVLSAGSVIPAFRVLVWLP